MPVTLEDGEATFVRDVLHSALDSDCWPELRDALVHSGEVDPDGQVRAIIEKLSEAEDFDTTPRMRSDPREEM